ncbi:hypothetical protein CFHF_20015 [Caulobacter flavus]|uniref:Uncharacterized protein n=1 Tax=Caulobacter flavus TaxID=1679497 RepID=A0A2N5CP70_9CAUL|nr:hypothetical protein [Caulobacter flavus]AYV48550.1 hypothetical protein C1707_21050 [Caulobacter flavus]PLR08734.1 hypothetical protein CFHF_20015 [Caulobacter flavus]
MDAPVDYWPQVVRQGVLALGFSVHRGFGAPILSADFIGPLEGWTRRAAQAALAMHKEAELSDDEQLVQARLRLLAALEQSAAADELAAYQDRLARAVWAAVRQDPPRRIEALGHAED